MFLTLLIYVIQEMFEMQEFAGSKKGNGDQLSTVFAFVTFEKVHLWPVRTKNQQICFISAEVRCQYIGRTCVCVLYTFLDIF